MFAALPIVFLFFLTGDRVVVCVNNLGALSCLEMAIVARAAVICLGNLCVCVCVSVQKLGDLLCYFILFIFYPCVCLHPLK